MSRQPANSNVSWLALGASRWFGAITPIGGVAWIVGWIALGVSALRKT